MVSLGCGLKSIFFEWLSLLFFAPSGCIFTACMRFSNQSVIMLQNKLYMKRTDFVRLLRANAVCSVVPEPQILLKLCYRDILLRGDTAVLYSGNLQLEWIKN